MTRQYGNPECQVECNVDTAMDDLTAQPCRVCRRVGAPVIAILLSILAILGSLPWWHMAYALPRPARQEIGEGDGSFASPHEVYGGPKVVKTILLEENAQPIAVAVNSKDNHVYVVNIGTGTVSVIDGTDLVKTIDLKTVTYPASACPVPTAYGACLNDVTVNTVTNHVYVTEWYQDVVQIISGTEAIDWVFGGRGPAGAVPHPNKDSIYVLDKWTPGVTVVQGDQDRCFMAGSEPNAGVVDPKTGYVYIANSGSNSVAVLDDCTKVADVPVGSYPNAVTYNPRNGYIYIVNSGSSPATVSVISRTQVIGTVPAGSSHTNLGVDGYWGIELDGSTHIIAAHPNGHVYVSNWASNTVSIIADTQWITDVVVGVNPNTVGVDPTTGYVYVANIGSDSVSVISGTEVITTVTVGNYPIDLAVNPATGRVYVTNRDDASVSILAASFKVLLPLVARNSASPALEFTYVPPYGSNENLQGRVRNVGPTDYKVAVYVYVSGWWNKPYWNSPLTSIQSNESWICDITTGGADPYATKIAAFLVPNGYRPPLMSGGQTLPTELSENSAASAMWEREPVMRKIEFSGYTWKVKASESLAGPGPNYFSDRVEDVWVDENGRLHLRIVQRDGRWYCTEVFTEAPLGYGTYVFSIASRADQLDKNVVLGLFTWDDTAPEHNYREIDIEFARWGQVANDNAQYVVQPWQPAGNMHRFNMVLSGSDSTHGFDWRADRIFFQSLQGHQPFPGSGEDEIASWVYTGGDIPPAGEGNARINFWLTNGTPPSDGRTAEVIVEAFTFVPRIEYGGQ